MYCSAVLISISCAVITALSVETKGNTQSNVVEAAINRTSNELTTRGIQDYAWIGIVKNCDTKTDKDLDPDKPRPKLGVEKCNKFERSKSQGFRIYWGEQSREGKSLFVYSDHSCHKPLLMAGES